MTDDLLRLLTAGLDGELTPAESQQLRQLLESSAEAQRIFAKLQADSARLRALPLVPPPPGLKHRVMARIAALTSPNVALHRPVAAPVTEPARRPWAADRRTDGPAQRRSWLPYVIAASVFLVIMTSSFLYFLEQDTPTTARSTHRPPAASRSGAEDPRWDDWLPVDSHPRPSVPLGSERATQSTKHAAQRLPARSETPNRNPAEGLALAPEPRPVRAALVGSGFIPDTHFDLVDVRVPFLQQLVDFERDDTRFRFVAELSLDPAFRIDLFVRNPGRSVELFREAASASGVNVLIDANTSRLLAKRQITALAVYCESLTAADLAGLLSRLSFEDTKVTPRVFGAVHVVPATTSDAADLKNLLGIDPGWFKRPNPDRPDLNSNERNDKPPARDPSKPLSSGTADHIVKSVSGGSNSPHGPTAEKLAVLCGWQPVVSRTPPGSSAEVKQFLAKRGERKPGATPVLIILRPGN